MPRVHKDYREGRCSRFTHGSKFDTDWTNTQRMAQEAIREGDKLRQMISGHRILLSIDHVDRDLKNAFRL